MFEQLRIKVAIRQTMSLGIMLILVLSLVYLYNYSRMIITIENTLNEISSIPFLSNNIGNGGFLGEDDRTMPRDCLSIYIDNNNIYYTSNDDFYESDTIESIIKYIVSNTDSGNNKIRVDGNYVAYRTEKTFLGRLIYLYDYTKEFVALRNVGIIIVVAGALGIAAIAMFSMRSAKKSVLPIEEAFNKQQDLVANASHELKTPLTIINTDLSILNSSRETLNKDQIKWLDSINSQIGRMSNLINEMLELARFDAVSEKVVFQTVSLSEVAYGVLLNAEVLAFENDIALNSKIEPDIKIQGVCANIEKLVYILVENALKYTNKGGKVDVEVYSERKRAILKIKNTGEGISKENLPKLFDRFYRTDESHGSSGSFGLGLAIAKAIVDSHNASIGVDSIPGEYTEFIVIFKQI
ncbi:hypothetical protein EOM82_07105 [bacterium]|nr:hypothetical protein [bacterium]